MDPTSLLVPDEDIDLETVSCGGTAQGFVTLRNLRSTPIEFTGRTTMPMVSLDPVSGSIPPGGSVDVRVLADASGADLAIGEVEGAITFITDTQSISRVVSVNVAGALLRVSEETLDYGISALDDLSGPRTLTFANTGNAPVDLNLSAVGAPFELEGDPLFTIEGGEFREVTIGYSPGVIGSYSSSLEISATGALCQPPPTSVALSGEVSDAPILVSSSVVDFGKTTCAAPITGTRLIFTNNLSEAQTLEFAVIDALPGDYEAPREIRLQPGEKGSATVSRSEVVAPQTLGLHSGKLQVTATPSGETMEVNLQHFVEAPFLALNGNLDFGVFDVGSGPGQLIEELDVRNIGNAPAIVGITPEAFVFEDIEVLAFPKSVSLATSGNQAADIISVIIDYQGKHGLKENVVFELIAPGQCSVIAPLPLELGIQE